MAKRDAKARSAGKNKTRGAVIGLVIFTLTSVLVTGTLGAIMGRFGTGATFEYSAIFSNASMVKKGDDVRVAGVVMGKVKKVEIHDTTRAKVWFSVDQDLPLTEASRVEIRYLNLVGARYVAVQEGERGAETLRPGSTIPIEQTSPALNLSALYNGFAPLFSALSPDNVNELSMNLLQVLQGEGGNLESLLESTASLTSSIADRDELVGQVITNLNTTLETADSRSEQLNQLVVELRRWIGGLAEDRVQIGNSVQSIAELTGTLADLLIDGREPLRANVAELRKLTGILSSSEGKRVLKQILRNLPQMLADQTRTGTYGSWYNYYICTVAVDIELPDELEFLGLNQIARQIQEFDFKSTAARCQL